MVPPRFPRLVRIRSRWRIDEDWRGRPRWFWWLGLLRLGPLRLPRGPVRLGFLRLGFLRLGLLQLNALPLDLHQLPPRRDRPRIRLVRSESLGVPRLLVMLALHVLGLRQEVC